MLDHKKKSMSLHELELPQLPDRIPRTNTMVNINTCETWAGLKSGKKNLTEKPKIQLTVSCLDVKRIQKFKINEKVLNLLFLYVYVLAIVLPKYIL